ncbi:MAG: hypothetical protein WCF06_00680, partial [Nitrososphaeraceae archaeon]
TYRMSGSVESLPSLYHQQRVYESRFSRMISFYELNLLSNSLVLHSSRLAYLESNDKLADIHQPSSHVDI